MTSKSIQTSKSDLKSKSKSKSIPAPLTISKLKKILESPTYRANRSIVTYDNFINEAHDILIKLSSDERRNFLNNHLDESKLNKWNEKKSKFMDISQCSFQHTPISISFYNFTYAHTPILASKIWFNFINLILDFKHGAAECDLTKCQQSDCYRHLTIIDQLYAFVNTSDESLYGINTQEFGVRGGFKLLLKVFNAAAINQPIPPIILSHNEYKQHPFLSHFIELDYHYLCCISPNEVRFSWIKQMLHNAHPIMSKKQYVNQLIQQFYIKKKKKKKKMITVDDETKDDEIRFLDDDDDDDDDEKKEDDISSVTTHEIGILIWLLATLPSLLDVRSAQKKLLKKEFDKYQETAANATLIDTMLDYLYWDEKYINQQLYEVHNIIMKDKNELTVFNYIQNEYSGNVSMAMFIKRFIDLHTANNRDSLSILFNGDISKNNKFYFQLIRIIFKINSMVSRLDKYFPFLLSKIVEWNEIDQLLFDNLLSSILSYIERYISDKSMMMKIVQKGSSKSDVILSKMVDVQRDKTKQMISKWIIEIIKLLNNKDYTQQFIYHLSALHFKYQNDSVEQFTLHILEKLIKECHIDLINYYIDINIHESKELVILHSECLLWLLCRCCFDKAIQIFLNQNNQKKMDLFFSKQMDGKFNNVFLCLSQHFMPDRITNSYQMNQARINIFKILLEYAKDNEDIKNEDIKKALLQKDQVNGKNAIQYAMDCQYQPLYNEMKQFMS